MATSIQSSGLITSKHILLTVHFSKPLCKYCISVLMTTLSSYFPLSFISCNVSKLDHDCISTASNNSLSCGWNTAQHCPAQWRCLTNSSYSLLTVHAIFSSPIVQTLAPDSRQGHVICLDQWELSIQVTWSVWVWDTGAALRQSLPSRGQWRTVSQLRVLTSHSVCYHGHQCTWGGHWVQNTDGWWNMYLFIFSFDDDFVNVL